MQIIPVIDLKNQQVVQAKAGNRSAYQPINTPLCPSSELFDVVARFLELYPFQLFYLADLDAIMQQGDHTWLIEKLLHHYPDIHFWVDNGCLLSAVPRNTPANYHCVIGTESQTDISRPLSDALILSLDFQQDTALGSNRLVNQPELWPETIILMTLAHIGMNHGPDFSKLKYYQHRHPDKNWVAAGGIRGVNDLLSLTNMGIQQALVSSCLHNGQLNHTDLQILADMENHQAKKYPT